MTKKKPNRRDLTERNLGPIRKLQQRMTKLEKLTAQYIAVVRKFQRIYEAHMRAHR